MKRALIAFAAIACLSAACALAQDEAPSLGDVARQARQQKQLKDATAKPAASKDVPSGDAGAKDVSATKSAHVITNEELPRAGMPSTSVSERDLPTAKKADAPASTGDREAAGEQWKSQIQSAKTTIAGLQHDIESESASIQYAGANCVANCVQWNEHQKQKQDDVDNMKAQLAVAQKQLEDLQDDCHRKGFGSSVCEP
jgi:hypothetical protein